jgi:hypothetical protein
VARQPVVVDGGDLIRQEKADAQQHQACTKTQAAVAKGNMKLQHAA